MKKTLAACPASASVASLSISCRGDRVFTCEPKRTALLVIDMQQDFFGPPDEDDPMRDVIPRIARLMAMARSLGCTLVHTRESYSPDLSDVTPFRKSLGYVGRDGPLGRFLVRGERGCKFVDEVRPLAHEVVIDKAGFSGFLGGELQRALAAAQVDQLILCGVTTQCCVHSTLRHAVDLGYWCLTVADCCAAETAELHEAALSIIAGEGNLFGWVADLSDIEAARGAARRSAKK